MNRRLLLLSLSAAFLCGTTPPAWAKGGSGGGGSGGGGSSGSGGSSSGGSGSGGSGSSGSGSGDSGSSGSDSGGSNDGSDDSGSGDSGSGSSDGGRSGLRRSNGDDLRADDIAVTYSGGESERVSGESYERLDAQGDLLERRAATGADLARLASAPGELKVFKNRESGAVEIVDRRGWRERMAGGTYVLTDPKGHVVRRRPLRAEDQRRFDALTD